MTKLEQVKSWDWLMEQVSKIQDHKLRMAVTEEYRERAMREWGWCPGNDGAKDVPPLLEPWQQEILEDIQTMKEFDVDPGKERREQTNAEAFMNMMEYVRDGGTLLGIPDNIRTAEIAELYFQCKDLFEKELNAQIENVKNTPVHALYEKSGITIPKNN